MRRTKNNEANKTSENAQKISFVSRYDFTYLYVGSLCHRRRVSANLHDVAVFFLAVPVRDLFFYVPSIFSVRHRRRVFSNSARRIAYVGGNAFRAIR